MLPIDTRISLKKLELFCLVADLGSLKNAAEQLYVTQPVVTAHIRSLNERLGVELLYRDRNRMRLTEAGEVVYEWARVLLTQTRDLERRLEGLTEGAGGTASIATSMTVGSYLLPPVVTAFKASRPDVHIAMSVAPPERAALAVEAGEADFGVVIADERFEVPAGLLVEVLGHERLVLVASADSVLDAGGISVQDLAQLAFVISPRDATRQRIVDRQLRERGVGERRVVAELGHAEAMKRVVRDGFGVSFLYASSVQDELSRGDLREIPVRDLELRAPILLLRREERHASRMQLDLMSAIRSAIGAGAPLVSGEALPLP